MLSEKLLYTLREYYKQYKLKPGLFEGQKSERYSPRSVKQVYKSALMKNNMRMFLDFKVLSFQSYTNVLHIFYEDILNLLEYKSTNFIIISTILSISEINTFSPIV